MPIPHDLSPSERRVLDVIWRHGPIARVDISPLTELSTMSVTRITRELTDRACWSRKSCAPAFAVSRRGR